MSINYLIKLMNNFSSTTTGSTTTGSTGSTATGSTTW